MTRRAEEAGTPHEEHDAPVVYIGRYLGIAVLLELSDESYLINY